MLTGLNHVTLAVSHLPKSLAFYVEMLGFTLKAKWNHGAYLLLGDFWLCLSLDKVSVGDDYTHYAFTISPENFDSFAERLRASGVTEWKTNKSEGKSLYFLDPDGHRLEIHDGDIQSRLTACLNQPYAGMEFF
ncbi:glutathione transferase [Pantoea deleyi]|uniref:Fosfomycin resistance glutathione transferase n=1 Tax=Pantoea deleyi TaxID=470932 RepID=A0A506QJ93_9GAMM|nr:fosfomycin resistance glutathione transferase [Pantoea deleyi]ORM72629.1 glutathione transferase [Pantoea deleyi]TPV45586.1 fosfomycin resistance glutathione transferase [Pantoea deleyi]